MTDVPQGKFHVHKRIDGALVITCPPTFVVAPAMAVRIAQAILKEVGVETIMADPGQTVIRPPRGGLAP